VELEYFVLGMLTVVNGRSDATNGSQIVDFCDVVEASSNFGY
jgi:hypothetical protein